jgi:site-specific DNA-methyltransferase (cytosine-N4-specific)
VSHINGMGHLGRSGGMIDGDCLGGHSRNVPMPGDAKRYWAGANASKNARSVATFLADYDEICEAISKSVRPGGKAVLVVGRRSTGAYRLKLDLFTIDRMAARGFDLVSREVRSLRRKHVPTKINRFARSRSVQDRERGLVSTMVDEIILVMQKRPDASHYLSRARSHSF